MATGVEPAPGAGLHGLLDPYAGDVPYSKRQSLTSPPFGLTVAFNAAVVCFTADAAPVSTVGGLGSVASVWSAPALVPPALVATTRNLKASGITEFESAVAYGGSPRATIHLVTAGRALAFIRGRSYVLGQDLAAVAPEVLRHRIVLSYEGIADDVAPDAIVRRVLETTEMPRLDLGDGRVV